MITVVEYGIVNLRNIVRALEYVGGKVLVSRSGKDVEGAERLVLPGVGAFASGMTELRSRGLDEAIVNAVNSGTPLLGICLGMQMLFEKSLENGCHAGLGLIPGDVVPIPRRDPNGFKKRKVPHVGWSELKLAAQRSSWHGTSLSGTSPGEYVYFLHSFMATTEEVNWPLAQCIYEGLPVVAAVESENVTGLQFHPERSGPAGLNILERFLKI